MCLLINSKRATRAKENILCYKILQTDDGGESYKTPWEYINVEPEKLVGDILFTAKGKPYFEQSINEYFKYSIERGFIHTYITYEDAVNGEKILEDIHRKYNLYRPKMFRIFKCIIPKGTKYHEGHTGIIPPIGPIKNNSYASTSIKIIEYSSKAINL